MRKNNANQDLRDRIKNLEMFQWQIAERIGVTDVTLTKWLRSELPENDERRKLINDAICCFEQGG